MHVGDRVLSQGLGHVGRHLGLEHVLRVLGQHAGDVQRHVANAQDRDLASLQRPRTRVIRVAVVPGHEVGRTVGLRQIHARNIQRVIAVRTRRNDDRIIVVTQVVDRHVAAHLDVAEQTNVATLKDLVQRDDDLLDTRVIRRDAVAHETVRRGKTLKQVDIHLEPRLGQDVRRVNASGTSANNGDVERCQPNSPSMTARECAHLGSQSSAPKPRATLAETPHTPQGTFAHTPRPGPVALSCAADPGLVNVYQTKRSTIRFANASSAVLASPLGSAASAATASSAQVRAS